MPRIAAVLSVLAAVAFSIGFNIVRYPIVWEKLARCENLAARSVESAAPARAETASPGRDDSGADASPAPHEELTEPDRVAASIPSGPEYGESKPSAVRRLPSVDDWQPSPRALDQPRPGAPAAGYPST